MNSLNEIIENHSGNVIDKWDSYSTSYERHIAPLRNSINTILEIGVQNGGSLEVWSKYFPNAESIIGVDINPDCKNLEFSCGKIEVIISDSTKLNNSLLRGKRFDLIIDDGSHVSSDIINSFFNLMTQTTDEAIYVIEDLCCSYWQEFEGGVNHPSSAITFFKKLIDIINIEHWRNQKSIDWLLAQYKNDICEKTISKLLTIQSITFENSMLFIIFGKQNSAIGVRKVFGNVASVATKQPNNSSISSVGTQQIRNTYSL